MNLARTFLLMMVATIVLTGCGKKKKVSLSGDDPVEVSDFIDFFTETQLPCQFTDSMLQKKEKDSLLISYKVFTQFIPDSAAHKLFGKGVKPKLYPLGKATVSKSETYLFVKAVTPAVKSIFILGFNKDNHYIAGMPVVRSDAPKSIERTASFDKKYTITKTQQRKNADGSISDGKDVYVLNTAAKEFMLIMTEALDDKVTELINPIDTLPRKNKLSADYSTGKMNLVSIRDGRKSDRITFFIHIDKNNGDCNGELKGEAILKSANLAEYREGGDPCVMQFHFTASSVSLTEIEGCGSHRGLRCAFDGAFPRKKEHKPTTKPVRPK